MKLFARILVTYLLLVFLFTVAVAAAFAIPRDAVEDNVRRSVEQVAGDGRMFTTQVGLVQPFKLGVFSDCLMLGIVYCADTDHPLRAAMADRFVMKDGSPVAGMRQMLDSASSDNLEMVIYSRYWHGNQVVLRPLLCFTTVHGIRIINIVLMASLWIALLVALWRRVGRAEALIVMSCLAVVMVPSVPMCMNYAPTFYIALAASLLVLLWRRVTVCETNAVLLFFVIGAVTSFFDLLTTPLVTMAVPLVVYMLYRKADSAWRVLIMMSLAWLSGYALLWATKWLLATVITGYDAFGDAFGAVEQRTVGHNEQDYMAWCFKMTALGLVAVVALTVAALALFGKSWCSVRRESWLLLLSMTAFLWAFVLLEHTWHHLHFTWRTFVVMLVGLALFLWRTLDLRHPLALFKKNQREN